VTVVVVAVAATAVAGLGAAAVPEVSLVVLAGLAAVALVVLVAYLPVIAVPIYLTVLPFLAGIERDALLPLVRPNEALLVLLVGGAALGGVVRLGRGDAVPWRPHPLDAPLLTFALVATVWPPLSLLVRGTAPTVAELAALMPVVKLAGLFLLARLTLQGTADVARCLRIVVRTAAAVAVIAVLQTLQVAPVISLLESVWPVTDAAEDVLERGTTTFASPIVTGDYVLIGLVILVCGAVRGLVGRRESRILAAVLAAGLLAAAQFSVWIAASVVAVLLLWRVPPLRRVARRLWPLLVVVAAVGAPAVLGRLAAFGSGAGVPDSWLGRWDNLTTFYLPRFEPLTVLLGVSPDPVLAAPETWRDVIYLESGYLELLWVGGVPLLAAFVWLSFRVLRASAILGRRDDPHGAAAQSLEIIWWYVLVLSVVDPHLTLRGTGDVLAVLLAVVAAAGVGRGPWPVPAAPPPAEPVVARAAAAAPRRRASRALDLVLVIPGLLVLSPLFALVAVVVRATSPGPAIFRQERVGYEGRPFTLYKFRTMAASADDDGALRDLIVRELRGEDTTTGGSAKLPDDPRITRVGAVLRRTSIDELPQLWNVLRGDMALVGPRPCLPWEAALFSPPDAERFRVRPGITGLWQVSGRSTLGTLAMLDLDRRYVATRSLRTDVAILARTLPVLLRGDGAR
jgi:lipopolysaccharide/colanic/teichoic acid biosynthesis glycosyltransferase